MDFKKLDIIFFDGHCNLCNGFINFLFKVDKNRIFHVASLQGKTSKELFDNDIDAENLKSIILYQNGIIYKKSKAVLIILKRLGLPWSILYPLIYLPTTFRDYCYDLIAINRYKLFGKKDTCRLPSEEEKLKFLE